jgi:hypothetical protein
LLARLRLGKERIEGFPPDVTALAATIVGKTDFDIVVPECLHPDVDGTAVIVRKACATEL